MDKRPAPSPEGRLIAEALRRRRPRVSGAEAARRAGISEARWRQIVSGFQTVSGQRIPVVGPPDTVARMAQVVGVTPDQLTEAGREDAAEELRQLGPFEEPAAEPTMEDIRQWMAEQRRRDAERDARIQELENRLAEREAEQERDERSG